MLACGRGAIVNIGSMSGYIVNKPQPQCYYNASKAGVHHLTKSLAAEWAERGVRVNAVAPTYIETPLTRFGMEDQRLYPVWLEMTPMRRVGQPHEPSQDPHRPHRRRATGMRSVLSHLLSRSRVSFRMPCARAECGYGAVMRSDALQPADRV